MLDGRHEVAGYDARVFVSCNDVLGGASPLGTFASAGMPESQDFDSALARDPVVEVEARAREQYTTNAR